ncbi:reticulon-1-A-like [Brevipalpus obovatus]|uniref:reticulon-1-A-like n=1 Tax=Brevipalpus obovatus TaxID=246614 RepID=UPI003D9F7B89
MDGTGFSLTPGVRKKVSQLIYWEDLKESGVVFAIGLLVLLSMAYFSIISVVAYVSLLSLSGTISLRIYRAILGAVQKKDEGPPFKKYLEMEICPSNEKVHHITEVFLKHFNATITKLRSVFLVEDIIDSLKYFVGFWCLTYVGSWFNGLTLIILSYLGLFSIPKLYEMHKTQIDGYLALANNHVQNVLSTIKSKLPGSKKDQ